MCDESEREGERGRECLHDDNFQFDENSRKFSKQVENTVGKGEIACY